MADRGAALAAAVGVVVGVHDRAAAAGTHAHVALAASLAQVDVLVVDVGDLAHHCGAAQRDVAHLAGGQADQGVAVLLGHQLGHVAGRAHQLGAAAGVQLDVVQDGTHGDVLEGQAVAGLDVGAGAADDGVAHLQPLGADDVALDAVGILHQADEGAAVGIILDGLDRGGHIQLLALEVDDAVLGAVAAALVPDGDLAGVVAAAVLLHGLQQAALGGDLGQDTVVRDGHAAAARGSGAVFLDSHCYSPLTYLMNYYRGHIPIGRPSAGRWVIRPCC